MSTDYDAIRQRNIKEYGEGTKHLSYFSDIYSTSTHFIFEVLQNAEDALSRRPANSPAGYVHFHLFPDRLEIRHNGEPFIEQNVIGICGIGEGTKAGDYTQIGKFGIGFKSVYAYTFFPQVHSGDEHFEIRRFVEPHAIEYVTEKDTLIVLPFDQPNKRPEWAFRENVSADEAVREIGNAIRKLGIRSLLFLRHIEEIKWTMPGDKTGHFIRSEPIVIAENHKKIEVLDHTELLEEWQIFSSQDVSVLDASTSHDIAVEVAFLVKDGKVSKANDTELVVYFPTEKETKLGFLVQAPFKTTKSRDNIKSDDSSNRQMIEVAAQLAADSLSTLCGNELLNVASYAALPLRVQDFSENSLFRPIYDKVREAFKTQPLLLADDGTFIKADEAKLALVKGLVELFSQEQLGNLFGKEKLKWLDVSITANKDETKDLHSYLNGLVEQIEANTTFASKLTADFFGKQPIDWLIKFIEYASGVKVLKELPFLRLAYGQHVSLQSDKSAQGSAWFEPTNKTGVDLSIFPLVHAELVASEPIRKFLEKEGVREIDATAIVSKCILPQYKGEGTPFDESNYRDHIRQIRKAYAESNEATRKLLTTNLNDVAWLACVHASGCSPDEIVWKKPGTTDLFVRTAEHETWFLGLGRVCAYFLHISVIEELNSDVSRVVKSADALTQNLHLSEYTVSLCNESCNHKQGLDGFKPDATIIGLQSALEVCNKGRALILWRIMLSAPRIIRGETQSASNKQKLDASTKKIEYTQVGKLCQEKSWLLDKEGNWHKPNELFLTDISDEFDSPSIRAKEVAEKLSMKQPEREQALELVTGGDSDLKRIIEQYQSGTDSDREKLKKMLPVEVSPQPAPPFKDALKGLARSQKGKIGEGDGNTHPVSNPTRYQEKRDDEVEDAVKTHLTSPHTVTFSPVRNQPSNSQARAFLYSEYQGKCQVTGDTFPKASANAEGVAENYFEACALSSYSNADYLNNEGNMLCVSADTMAKLKNANFEWVDDIEAVIETFKQVGSTLERIEVRVQLAGKECTVTWSQRHFMRLVALWEKA